MYREGDSTDFENGCYEIPKMLEVMLMVKIQKLYEISNVNDVST